MRSRYGDTTPDLLSSFDRTAAPIMSTSIQPPPPLAGVPPPGSVAVVSPYFLAPYNVVLIVSEKTFSLSDRRLEVMDVNGNVMFKVKGVHFSMRDRRILLDAADNPILSMQQKIISAHGRWLVFRGDSSDEKDLLFTVKKSSLFQLKTQLDVFLAGNSSEHACDFKIRGSFFERSCTIYLGATDTIVAEMKKKHTVTNIVLGKDQFAVTVYPNVDYAFIVALIVILNATNEAGGEND